MICAAFFSSIRHVERNPHDEVSAHNRPHTCRTLGNSPSINRMTTDHRLGHPAHGFRTGRSLSFLGVLIKFVHPIWEKIRSVWLSQGRPGCAIGSCTRWTTNCYALGDLVHDKLGNGRSYKMLTVLNEFTPQALALALALAVTARTQMDADGVLSTAAEARHARAHPIRQRAVQWHAAREGSQCRLVQDHRTRIDRQKTRAEEIQSHPPTSGLQHAPARPGNTMRDSKIHGLDIGRCKPNGSAPRNSFEAQSITGQGNAIGAGQMIS